MGMDMLVRKLQIFCVNRGCKREVFMSVKLIEKLAYILTKMSAALLIGIGLYHLVKQNLNHDSFSAFFAGCF